MKFIHRMLFNANTGNPKISKFQLNQIWMLKLKSHHNVRTIVIFNNQDHVNNYVILLQK